MTDVLAAPRARRRPRSATRKPGQAVVRAILREDLDLDPVDVRWTRRRCGPTRTRRRSIGTSTARRTSSRPGSPATTGRDRGAFPDPERTHRRGEPRAAGPVGRPRPVRRRPGGGVDLRPGRRRHEVRSGRHRRRRARPPALGLTPRAPVTIESVVEEECSGNGTLQTLLAGYTAEAAVIAEPFGAAITTSQVGVLWFRCGSPACRAMPRRAGTPRTRSRRASR